MAAPVFGQLKMTLEFFHNDQRDGVGLMQTRNVFILSFIVAMAAACTDAGRPELDKQVKELTDKTVAGRQRVANRHVMKPSVEVPSVSAGVSFAPAMDMATALDLPVGMVVEASLTSPDVEAALILPNYGIIAPRKNKSLVVMSTGLVNHEHLPEPGTDLLAPGSDGDAVTLRITVKVPNNANRLSFDYNFLSAESPDFIGSEYNDIFTVRLTSAGESREIAKASVNSSSFFDASETRADNTGFELLMADDPAGVDSFPPSMPLEGFGLFPDSGLTDWQTVNVEVKRGGVVTLEFDIRDLGDGALDSTVVIDNITFSGLEAVDPNPSLIETTGEEEGTVKTDPDELAVKGRPMESVAADGVTQLLLRANVAGPGKMKFSLPGATAPANGGVGEIGTAVRSDSVTVDVQRTTSGYYAFALYTSPEDFNTGTDDAARTRTVNITAQYLPTSGAGFEGQKTIKIVRPPLVIVHDIWSSCDFWDGDTSIYSNELFDVTCADYSETDSASFEKNKKVVPKAVFNALTNMRGMGGRGSAVTQVDVIAHGVGGLLVRKYVDSPEYLSSENFNAGSLNRLITMNTPHLGTRMANAIVETREKLKESEDPDDWLNFKKSLSDSDIYVEGAVDDFKTDSEAISTIGETKVPSHVMYSRGGLSVRSDMFDRVVFNKLKPLYTNLETYHPWGKELLRGRDSKLFCSDDHDMFVVEADQKGGLDKDGEPSPFISRFVLSIAAQQSEHFKLTRSAVHRDELVRLLNSKTIGGRFAPSLPRPDSVRPETSCGSTSIVSSLPSGGSNSQSAGWSKRVQSLMAGSLKIVSPSAGTPVSPGSNVTVVLEASDGFVPKVVLISGPDDTAVLETSPFTAEFLVPEHAIGTVTLTAYGINAQGKMLFASPVILPVALSAKLTSIRILNGDVALWGAGSTQRLLVRGHYDDGVTRTISSPSLGTVYSSSNPGVVTVANDGTVTGRGPGIATIVVRNGTVFTSITVTVGNESPNRCIEVRLGDYNLFTLEDYTQGHYVQGRVAAGGNITLHDFSVGEKLAATDTANALVAGGDITLSSGGVWGDVRYGGNLVSNETVSILRGAAAQGTPIDFSARGNALRALSSELAALPANGTTTVESWGGILLHGAAAGVNVFNVDGSAFSSATLLSIDAPANSLAVINVRGTPASLSSFGQSLSGGIDGHGILFNFPNATSLTASGYGLLGTVLAPQAHVTFNDGGWFGGFYARSMMGNAAGHLNKLRDTDICR